MFFGARPTVGAPVSTQNVRGVHNADFTMYRPQLGRSWLLGTLGGAINHGGRWCLELDRDSTRVGITNDSF